MFVFICLSLFGAAIGAPTSCQQPCSAVYSPVCGSNGHTYSSHCTLSIASCQAQQQGQDPLYMTRSGPCHGGSILGGALGGGAACSQFCDEVISPLCASDGVVYENRCKFTIAQCEAAKNGTRLSIVSYTSTCPTPVDPNCEQYSKNTSDLALEGGQGSGVKILCPHSSHEVCTTHGTYKSECQLCQMIDNMLSANSQHHLMIPPGAQMPEYKILYDGPCHSANSHYPYGGSYPYYVNPNGPFKG